jgi:tetratricopeptide (TPR) repeat protein
MGGLETAGIIAIEKNFNLRIMPAAMQRSEKKFPDVRWIYAALAVSTLALYLPALSHTFLEYDDQQYVTDNAHVQAGLTWKGLLWAFGFYAGNWHPLAWLSHMLDCQLFAARAWGHHLTNVLLHTANTLLLFALVKRLTRCVWRSAAVAALFAWHPLHVESVAWVAERKDVLCAFFWLLTLLAYVRYAELVHPSRMRDAARSPKVWYGVTLLAFGCALMAKPMAVTLPFVLLLLDFWPLQRFTIYDLRSTIFLRGIIEKVPFFILAALGCWLTLRAQSAAIVSTGGLTLAQRSIHTLAAYDHYFWAMFFPVNLAVYYPYIVKLDAGTVVFSAVVLAISSFAALMNWKARPWILFGWLWFLGTLVPVIGLVQVGDQAWADRYTYLPFIGLSVAVVWLAVEIFRNKKTLWLLSAAAGAAMLVVTSFQLSYWQDTRTLFEHAKSVTANNYLAVTMIGSELARAHKYDEAIADYHTALGWQPDFPEAHFFLGAALDELGHTDEAIAEYQRALWFKPVQEQARIFIGMAYGKEKRYDEAVASYNDALKINPDSAVAHNNLARIFHTQGKLDDAAAHYRTALELDPKLALAHNNYGILLLQQNNLADGTAQLREALRLNPTNAETMFNLGLALNQQAQWGEAAGLFSKTVGPESPDPKAHYEFGRALAHGKKTREAMREFASALLLQPDFPDALDALAWILSADAEAANRNGTQAVAMAGRACELTANRDAEKLKTLAAALAESGDFEGAKKTINLALTMAGDEESKGLSRRMAESFAQGKPWREN